MRWSIDGAERFVSMAEPFIASVKRDPNKQAVICGETTLSYGELNAAVNRMAHVLVDGYGIKRNDKVAYLLPNGVEIVEVYYALQKIGAVSVPVSTRLISQEIGGILKSSGARMLICIGRFSEKAERAARESGSAAQVVCIDGITPSKDDEFSRLMEEAPIDEPALVRDAAALSRIQYTGGSTGAPKGVARTHGADLVETDGILASNGLADRLDNVVLIQCPLEHHGGHSWLITSIAAGATLVICDKFDPQTILSSIERYRVTYMILLPPTSYARLLRHPAVALFDLDSVKLVQSSAGGMTKEVIGEIFARFPHAVLNYGWGQSECGLGSSLQISREMYEQNSLLLTSVGQPMRHAEMKVMLSDDVEAPVGHVGELFFRSQAGMKGYYDQPEATSEVFAKDGWIKTGDLMRRDAEGYFYFVSRQKDVIKSGGENVYSSEVEAVILSHPLVDDCFVFGTKDPIMGEAVAALVKVSEGACLTAEELLDHCRAHMASYKKPRYLLFVDDLGRNDAGKIRKQTMIGYFDEHKREAVAFVPSSASR